MLHGIEGLSNGDCPPCVGVGQVFHFFDSYRALHQSLGFAGNAGESPVRATFTRTLVNDHPFGNPVKASEIGNPWLDLAVHDINLMLHLFGEPTSFMVVPGGVNVSPSDPQYLLRCKVVFSYAWGDVLVDAGIDAQQFEPFAHSYCVELPDNEAFVMSSTQTSWRAFSLEPTTTISASGAEWSVIGRNAFRITA